MDASWAYHRNYNETIEAVSNAVLSFERNRANRNAFDCASKQLTIWLVERRGSVTATEGFKGDLYGNKYYKHR